MGYQGGTGALINMGALDMGLTEEELPEIVTRWRNANGRIRDLGYEMDEKARKVIAFGGTETISIKQADPRMGACLTLAREYDKAQGVQKLVITLPSGRQLFYINPAIGQNRFGSESILYYGVDQTTKQWRPIETYGGKLVENCVQAIARDCLAYVLDRLAAAELHVVFHVHDEVVIDSPVFDTPANMLKKVEDIMRQPPVWAAGLPLNADGWVGNYFTKD